MNKKIIDCKDGTLAPSMGFIRFDLRRDDGQQNTEAMDLSTCVFQVIGFGGR